MTRVRTWAIPALALIPLGLGIPLIAQNAKGKSNDVNEAKKMANLITTGQMNLRDATTMAEKHVKGVALEATCEIKSGSPMPPAHGHGGGPQDKNAKNDPQHRSMNDSGERLEYQVCCYANGKIQSVRIDGRSKTVLDVKEKQQLDSND